MKLIITRNVFIGGRLLEANPLPVEVSEADAKQLLLLEKAIKAPEPVAAETPAADDGQSKPETPEERKAREKAEREAAKAANK